MGRPGMNRRLAGAGAAAVLILVALLWYGGGLLPGGGTDAAEDAPEEETFAVDCPDRILSVCENLSAEHRANATFLYTAEYTNRNGSAYYVELASTEPIVDGERRVKAHIGGETLNVWSIRPFEE